MTVDQEIIKTTRSFLWSLVHQKEKVPGAVRHIVRLLEPDLTEDQQHEISKQIINQLYCGPTKRNKENTKKLGG